MKSIKPTHALGLIAGLLLTAFAAPASAGTLVYYKGTDCRPDGDSQAFTKNADGSIVAGSNGSNITCPITKTTSGPGVTDDSIYAAELQIDTGPNATSRVACSLFVYQNIFTDGNHTNIVPGQIFNEAIAEGAHLTAIGFDSETTNNFWSPAGGGWLTAEMHCELTAGATLFTYLVAENGTDQGTRIYGPSSCTKNAGMSASLFFVPSMNGDLNNPGLMGYMESREGAAPDKFTVNCPAAAGSTRIVDVTASSNFNDNVYCGGVNVATKGTPEFQAVRTSITATSAFDCTQPGSGDGNLFSFRVNPVRVDAGGTGTSPFTTDANNAGGTTIYHNNTITTSGVANAAPAAVYKGARVGTFTYTLPGYPAGSTHRVRLHFAETYFTKAGGRAFNVSINGASVLSSFDIYAAAGNKANKAVVKDFTKAADSQGRFVIKVTNANPAKDQGLLSGLEIQ